MKLNYKRTILVGFAFFLISAFWQAYDSIIPLMLTNHYGLNDFWSGGVMALDNVFAVFMLPIFGALSDKVATKYGKRTPFIFIGTILAVVSLVILSVVDHTQHRTVTEYELDGPAYEEATKLNTEVDKLFLTYGTEDETVVEIAENEKKALIDLFAAKDIPSQYEAVDAFRDEAYKLMKEARSTENKELIETADAQLTSVDTLMRNISETTYGVTKANPTSLILFIVMLLFVLLSMATFRSPAVALMPDVTVKPLRSKGNAIINLMGTAGGIIILLFGKIFGTSRIYMSYVGYFIAVAAVMLIALAVFIFTVKENKWANEMVEDTKKYGIEENEAEAPTQKRKLSKPERISLILILASVALWYIGYNSITSKYSVYATRELGFDYSMTLLIAQAAAVVAYIPVGIVSSKIGRRKAILAGVLMLTAAFACGHFITPITPEFIMYPIFILAGIGWATINVNSFPMVVELAKGSDTGKYTGYYYTASMAAQIVAPLLSGALYVAFGMRNVFFVFGAIFVALSFVTMFFVKHGDAKPEKQSALEALGGADD